GSKPRLLVTVPWADLVGAFPAEGVVANDGPRPAMTLFTRAGAEITVCPAAKPTGSLRTASGAKTQELIDQVNAKVESIRRP
ncbi:MAG: hypothetical protein LBU50_07715, partial [Cellulomonas sp.]|nr:hypothetical protein [Cellulomonas sp.]